MTQPRDVDVLLEDMLSYAQRGLRLVAGRQRTDLDMDIALEGALIHALAMIGEAARNVPEDFRTRFPEVGWRRWVGFRNILIHAYHRVDLDAVWEASVEELEPLVAAITRIIEAEFGADEVEP